MVPFGPLRDALPASFTREIEYADSPIRVIVRASFDGQQVAVRSVEVHGRDEHAVTPRDVAGLELGAVVRNVAEAITDPGDGAHVDHRPGRKPTDEELQLVAAVYWFHHVIGGEPRRAVMAHWDLPRSTANRWITRCRERFDMPEVGSHG